MSSHFQTLQNSGCSQQKVCKKCHCFRTSENTLSSIPLLLRGLQNAWSLRPCGLHPCPVGLSWGTYRVGHNMDPPPPSPRPPYNNDHVTTMTTWFDNMATTTYMLSNHMTLSKHQSKCPNLAHRLQRQSWNSESISKPQNTIRYTRMCNDTPRYRWTLKTLWGVAFI